MTQDHGPTLDPDRPWSYVRGLQATSFCDWPGRVSAVIFLATCNLRCPTCHNGLLAWTPEKLPNISKNYATRYLQARQQWLDGVVLTGGEPTCVPGIVPLLQDVAQLGLPIKLDTNGLRPEIVRTLLDSGMVDFVAVDVKGPWAKYPVLTGQRCSPEQACSTLNSLFSLAQEAPERFMFRCTAVPELSQADLHATKANLPPGFDLTIQTYVPPPGHKAPIQTAV